MDAAVAALLGVGITAVVTVANSWASHFLQERREARQAKEVADGQRVADRRDLYARFMRSVEDLRVALLNVASAMATDEQADAFKHARQAQAEFHRLFYEILLVTEHTETTIAAAEVQKAFNDVMDGLQTLARSEFDPSVSRPDDVTRDLDRAGKALSVFVVAARLEILHPGLAKGRTSHAVNSGPTAEGN